MKSLAILVSLLVATSASATPPQKTQKQQNTLSWEQAIAHCTAHVRALNLHYSRFDAYAVGTRVRFIGTDEQRFQFEKCLYEQGYPLEDK